MTQLVRQADFPLLGLLMARTQSSFDEEALGAIRRANDLLRKADLSWDVLLIQFIHRKLTEQDAKDAEASRELDPCKVLEQTLKWLFDNEKMSEEQYGVMLQSVRMMFVSRDTNFVRRTTRRIKELFSRPRMEATS